MCHFVSKKAILSNKSTDATIGDALRLMRENKIGGIPIVDGGGKLAGILTNRDLRFEEDMQRPVSEVMTKENLVTAPEGTDLKAAEKILRPGPLALDGRPK